MATHEITIHENTGATKEVAPYLGTYLVKDSLRLTDILDKLAEKSGLTAVQVDAILYGAFSAIEKLENEMPTRIATDIGTVHLFISGSFPTADAAFNPATNKLLVAIKPDDDIRLELADVTPTIVNEATATKVRVDNVADLEYTKPYNVIHGRHKFRVTGMNIVTTDAGATVKLVDENKVNHDVVVDTVESKQIFVAHSSTLLDGGDYKLLVASRGGDAEGPLQTTFRKVKYIRMEDPEPVFSMAKSEGLEDGHIANCGSIDIYGTNLTSYNTGDKIYAKVIYDGETEEQTVQFTITTVTATKIKVNGLDSERPGKVGTTAKLYPGALTGSHIEATFDGI